MPSPRLFKGLLMRCKSIHWATANCGADYWRLFLTRNGAVLDKWGPKGLWDSRLALIEAMNDTTPIVNLNNKLFPADGSHYRSQQLKTIERVFGIKSPILPESRLIGRIP